MAVGGVTVALACVAGAVARVAAGERAVSATCFGYAPTKVGTSGKDELVGTAGNDVILSLGGDDVIFGFGGSDRICAGRGHDIVFGGAGSDRIDGGPGNDLLFANTGSGEVVLGGSGADTCSAERIVRGCELSRDRPPPPPQPPPQQPPAGPALPHYELGRIECLNGGQLRAYPPRVMRSVYNVNYVNPELVKWQPVLQAATGNGDWTNSDTTKPVYQAFATSDGVYEDAYGNGGWLGPDSLKLGFVTFPNLRVGTYRIRNYLYWQKLGKWYFADSTQTCRFS